jgi:2-keto-4-pentenoate hydratase/2-oxohepta-3-ene-1,7-dioic acid hydratase in catechol pathway
MHASPSVVTVTNMALNCGRGYTVHHHPDMRARRAEAFMKICRFDDNRLGLVSADGNSVADVTKITDDLPVVRWPRLPADPFFARLPELRAGIEALARSASWIPIDRVALRSPVAGPSKLIAAPVNYRAHIDEANADKGINFGATVKSIEEYGLFLKASSSIVGPSDGVKLPPLDRRVDHEVELVAVIGREGHRIPRDRALEHVAAYSIGLDMTVRGPEDRSWRKSFDTFAVIGPWLVTADEIPDPGHLDLRLTVNGTPRQSANTSALNFDVPRLVEYASSTYTLYPGDVIMTGTPEGVGPVAAGDILECFIESIGTMRVAIHSA